MSEKNGTTQELLRKLERGIEDVRSSERFREYLDTCARFHNYSLGNQILIAMQKPTATRVAGFHTWLGMDRHVMRGEKGIKILAPMTFKSFRGRKDEDDETAETVTTFRTVHVFDVSQTDGKPLPEIARHLDGDDGSLYARLAAIAIGEGLTIERGAKSTSANGYYNYAARTIWVSSELSPTMAVKTMAHELAHHFGGHTGSCVQSRNVIECIAESVAYVVLGHFGIDSSQYSFDYVATWSQDAKVFKSELAEISRVAKTIIERIGQEPETAPLDPAPAIAIVEPVREPSIVAAPLPGASATAPVYADAARPRMCWVRKEKHSGTGTKTRYRFYYEPVTSKTPSRAKIVPAPLTEYEYAGVTFVRCLAAGIASAIGIRKPRSIYVSWPLAPQARSVLQTFSKTGKMPKGWNLRVGSGEPMKEAA